MSSSLCSVQQFQTTQEGENFWNPTETRTAYEASWCTGFFSIHAVSHAKSRYKIQKRSKEERFNSKCKWNMKPTGVAPASSLSIFQARAPYSDTVSAVRTETNVSFRVREKGKSRRGFMKMVREEQSNLRALTCMVRQL